MASLRGATVGEPGIPTEALEPQLNKIAGKIYYLDRLVSQLGPEAAFLAFESESTDTELERFLAVARLDVVGVFGYSDEDGTEAACLDGKLTADEIAERVTRVSELVEELMAQRAEDRVGTCVEVLVESTGGEGDDGDVVGRALHQGPDTDGVTTVGPVAGRHTGETPATGPTRGQVVRAVVTASEGVDLVARAEGAPW